MTTAEHASSAAAPQDLRSIPFTPAHLPAALRLSEQVGWPHRVEDWELNLSLSDGVAVMEGEELVGTAFCTRFGDAALLNMIIVDERRRGRGLGRRVMEEAIALAGGRKMRLVATPEGMPLYRKLGFVSVGQITQYQGVALGNTPELPVSPGTAEDAGRLTAMDRDATGMERGELLRRIAGQGQVLPTEGGVTEISVVLALIQLMGLAGLAFVWISQTRINTANYYLAAVNMESFAETVFRIKFPKIVWACVVGAITYVLMLADVFAYILQALAYQGIFVVAWVAIALTHILQIERSASDPGSFSLEHSTAVNPAGLGAWLFAAFVGLAMHFAGDTFAVYSAPATFVVAALAYMILNRSTVN